MTELTAQQERFCREYIIDLNATQSAIRAGYSDKTADVQGCRLLGNVKVASRISELKAQRVDEVKTDANYVLKRLLEIDALDVADIVDESGDLIPVKNWPKAWRTSVNAIEVVQMKSTEDVVAYLKKIKIPDKIKTLELLGKHIDVSAFKDRLELTGKDGGELIINVTSEKAKEGISKLKESLL
jgi:phage terminase small subunit